MLAMLEVRGSEITLQPSVWIHQQQQSCRQLTCLAFCQASLASQLHFKAASSMLADWVHRSSQLALPQHGCPILLPVTAF